MSVVVCAYNEEETIEASVRSVLDSSYPDLELLVCDDGSTDATAALAEQCGARVLRLDHGGLSNARNVGWQSASGQIVAYLDADAMCHPDWPFHLAMSLENGASATGGPNLPVDGVDLVERAVAHVPGQASEVLLGPASAEHVPGCNMAFVRERLEQVGGFDVRYTAAGDDVDICWKLLDDGDQIGFSAAAQVEHHRRGTVRRFLRQQVGYGRAERMLAGPHRHRLNGLGQARWSGFVYGPGAMLPGLLKSSVYTGWAGTAPFQMSVGDRARRAGGLINATLPAVVAGGAIGVAGALVWPPALAITLLSLVWTAAVAVAAGSSVRLAHTEPNPMRVRSLVGLLTILQPLARTIGRLHGHALSSEARAATPWTGDRMRWIHDVTDGLRGRRFGVVMGGSGDFWDLKVTKGPFVALIATAVVWGWEPRMHVRYRLSGIWALALVGVVAISAAIDSRAAAATAVGVAVLCAVQLWRLASAVRAVGAATAAVDLSGSAR